MIKYILTIVALTFTLSAQAQTVRSWQELGRYVGEQTNKINELNEKLRFQQGLLDQQAKLISSQAATIGLYKTHINLQRVYILDFACKYNTLVEQLSKGQPAGATVLTPAGTPSVTYQPPNARTTCDGKSPAPEWPEALP